MEGTISAMKAGFSQLGFLRKTTEGNLRKYVD